ncbi:MAG: ABC transporter ATP-binding protein [Thermoplasmatales archaeon]
MVLNVKNLNVYYNTIAGNVKVIDQMNLDINDGEIIAIVGESASGKSTLGQVLTRMLPPTAIIEGEVIFDDKDIIKLNDNEMTQLRGTSLFMIFQNPLNSLDPVKTIGYQLLEAIKIRRTREGLNTENGIMEKEAIEALSSLRVPDSASIMKRYPHELSGGQVQRVVICMALLLRPKLLIADEPTTALDVTIQAQVIDILKRLNRNLSLTIIFITHDIGIAYVISNNIVVMYSGRIMEQGPTELIVHKPKHPYTVGLLQSIPTTSKHEGKLYSITGSPPSYLSLSSGCKFSERCKFVFEKCKVEEPPLIKVEKESVRCWLYE